MYVVQLLVSLTSTSATSWGSLFDRLKDQQLLKNLCTMDGCCVNGHVEHCAVWTAALETILKQNSVDVKAILLQQQVKPITNWAKQAIGQATAADSQVLDDGDDAGGGANATNVFSVQELLNFGADELTPAADMMVAWQCELSLRLLTQARPGICVLVSHTHTQSHTHTHGFTRARQCQIRASCGRLVEMPHRDRTTVVVNATNDNKGKSKIEVDLLFAINDQFELLTSPVDPRVQLYKLPPDFRLVFTGNVCAPSDKDLGRTSEK